MVKAATMTANPRGNEDGDDDDSHEGAIDKDSDEDSDEGPGEQRRVLTLIKVSNVCSPIECGRRRHERSLKTLCSCLHG